MTHTTRHHIEFNLTLANLRTGKLCRPPALTGFTTQNQLVVTGFNQSISLSTAIHSPKLRNRLKPQGNAAAKLTNTRQSILQPFNPPQSVQFIDMKPNTPIQISLKRQGFKN